MLSVIIIDKNQLLVENTIIHGLFEGIYQQNGAFFNKTPLFLEKRLAGYRYSHIFAQILFTNTLKN